MTIRRIVGLAVLAGAVLTPLGVSAAVQANNGTVPVISAPKHSPTPRATRTPQPTATPRIKPTATPRPTRTPEPTRTPRPTPTPKPCHNAYHCGSGGTVISSTAFTVKLPQSQIALSGAATQSQYGTQVWLVHAASRNLPQHAVAFKAIADGHLPVMHLAQKGTLYQYVPATNSWVHVSSVANSQIHAVVLTK